MNQSGSRAVITGTGLYAPEKVVTNDFFSRKYNREMNSFLVNERGIHERRFMSADQATSDLAVPAAIEAMRAARVSAHDLDLIIVATDTPDYISPSTASVVQHRLGAKRAGSFDLNTACAGFVTALDVASKYIATDERYQTILVVGAYGMSKYFDWNDYKTTSIFADGAGAVIVQRSSSGAGVLASELATLGQYHDHMGIYSGGTRTPVTAESMLARQHLLQFTKRVPPELNVIEWPKLVESLVSRVGATVDDVAHFFFTQVNIKSINDVCSILEVPREKAHNIMDRFGYTGSACIPMALADAASKHKLREGDLVLLIGSGGGVTMAGIALRWSYNT